MQRCGLYERPSRFSTGDNYNSPRNVESGEARVAFRLAGTEYHWDATVNDDWVEPTILSRFAQVLTRVGKSRRFTYINLGGQDCLIGCATAKERSKLAKLTGLNVEWLT
jgi:hypothetical protein